MEDIIKAISDELENIKDYVSEHETIEWDVNKSVDSIKNELQNIQEEIKEYKLEQTQRALELACKELVEADCCFSQCEHTDDKCRCFAVKNTGRNDVLNICAEQYYKYFLKEASNE